MASRVFLESLQNKLKGGNSRSIHINALPGRLTTRLDLAHLDYVQPGLAADFIRQLLTTPRFEVRISLDALDLNELSQDEQKRVGQVSKRLTSIVVENDDYHKDHGIRTFGFGYPILIRRSRKDPAKVIKAPLFIWPLDILKSKTRANEWSILRNKSKSDAGKLEDDDRHPITDNVVLASLVAGEDGIKLPTLNAEAMEDLLLDEAELVEACAAVLIAINSGSETDYVPSLRQKIASQVNPLPDAADADAVAAEKGFVHFGGVFGLFRAQKETIITDITKLLDRFDEFQFDNLQVESLTTSSLSAVDTDPSQQAILRKAQGEANQIIQGPPGTGKSQSLTALITNALANRLKCLVVCEKKTALDVIKANLVELSPEVGNLVAVIDDVNEDRTAIVDSVRARHENARAFVPSAQLEYRHTQAKDAVTESILHINKQHQALAQTIHQGETWPQILGRYLALKRSIGELRLKDVLTRTDFNLRAGSDELKTLLATLVKAERLERAAKAVKPVFEPLSDDLFKDTPHNEARLTVEETAARMVREMQDVQSLLAKVQTEDTAWTTAFFDRAPDVLANALAPFRPRFHGENFSAPTLPAELPLERDIKALHADINAQIAEAEAAKNAYQLWLSQHYGAYYEDVRDAADRHLGFAQTQAGVYGERFYDNTGGQRALTAVLGIFSKRQKEKSIARKTLVEMVSPIDTAVDSEAYVAHEFVEAPDQPNLRVYVENTAALKEKLEQWFATTPAMVSSYLQTLDGHAFHPKASDHRERGEALLARFADVEQTVGQLRIREPQRSAPKNVDELVAAYRRTAAQLEDLLGLVTQFRQEADRRLVRDRQLHERVWAATGSAANVLHAPLALSEPGSTASFLRGAEIFEETCRTIGRCLPDFVAYHDWRTAYLKLSERDKRTVDKISGHLESGWADAFECLYLYWLLSLHEPRDLPRNDDDLLKLKEQKKLYNDYGIKTTVSYWSEQQAATARHLSSRGFTINGLYNKRGSKGAKRNSMRTIIASDFNLFTSYFPVVLVNPGVCSSILPLTEGLFDLILFDEASQLRLEDTYAALIRGKAKVVSGDKHQMPPSAYFQGGGTLFDPVDEDAEPTDEDSEETIQRTQLAGVHRDLADSESLLAYAEDKGYNQSYLSVHYRSQHPYLIDFSNHAFYGRRLIPVPAKGAYRPIEYIAVNGTTANQVNEAEARKVVEILRTSIEPFANGEYPSVGVATFNLYQRNLILEEIARTRLLDKSFDVLMSKLGQNFFVKNLENIQGDERDVIILSTTYGPKLNGTFSQAMGPVIQSKGHRMLNVIVTRAKYKVFVCTSIPDQYLSQYSDLLRQHGNTGRGILYAYLNYARAVSEGAEDRRQAILRELDAHCSDRDYSITDPGPGSESPFEEEVFQRLVQHIGAERITQQYKEGGFRIDMVIRSARDGRPVIALECDGAKYHSSPEAYGWDLFRQEQLEKYGFVFYRIWSSNWWNAADRELEQLLAFIRAQDAAEGTTPAKLSGFPYSTPQTSAATQPGAAAPEVKETRKQVTRNSLVAVQNTDGKVLRLRFSPNPRLRHATTGNDGVTLIYDGAPIAKAVIGKYEGDVCQLGELLEVYYRILEVE